jgi:hypothetical protein
MDDNMPRSTERTAEEIAWDEEFRDDYNSGSGSNVRDLARFAARVPAALVQMPMSILPDETVRHARASAREGFLAVRSLLGAIGDRIEDMLAEPGTPSATVQGPPGTWGTGRTASSYSTGSASPGKARRIEVDSIDSPEPATGPGGMP